MHLCTHSCCVSTKTLEQSPVCPAPFPQTTGTPSPHTETASAPLYLVTLEQQLEQQCRHPLPSRAGGHCHHYLLPSSLSWCCRALGAGMHRGKGWRTAILGWWSTLLWLTFKLVLRSSGWPLPSHCSLLLSSQLVGGSIQWVTASYRTATPGTAVSFSTDAQSLPFPDQWKTKSMVCVYHDSMCTEHKRLAVYHSSHPRSSLISFLHWQEGPHGLPYI